MRIKICPNCSHFYYNKDGAPICELKSQLKCSPKTKILYEDGEPTITMHKNRPPSVWDELRKMDVQSFALVLLKYSQSALYRRNRLVNKEDPGEVYDWLRDFAENTDESILHPKHECAECLSTEYEIIRDPGDADPSCYEVLCKHCGHAIYFNSVHEPDSFEYMIDQFKGLLEWEKLVRNNN